MRPRGTQIKIVNEIMCHVSRKSMVIDGPQFEAHDIVNNQMRTVILFVGQ